MGDILLTNPPHKKRAKLQASSSRQRLWKHTTRLTCLTLTTQWVWGDADHHEIITMIQAVHSLPTCKHSSCTLSSVVRTREIPPLHPLRSALMVLLSGGTTAGLWNFTIPRDWGGWLVGTVSDLTLEDICLQPWPAGHWDPTLVADCSPISDHSCDVAAAFSVSPVSSHSSELCHRHALISAVVD